MIDDFKEITGTALRLTSLAAAAAFALLVTMSFLCAAGLCLRAAEIWPDPGLPDRGRGVLCRDADRGRLLHGAEKQVKARAAEAARSAAHSPLADPDADCGRPPARPRHRRQEADPATGGRRPRFGNTGKPQRAQR